jgi:hypothetical protein
MGFRRCIMPEANIEPGLPQAQATLSASKGADRGQLAGDCELVGVRTVGDALDALLG